ncbi:MAG: hypothetical protein FPO08_03780 [Geobacter sp.]|nr:MAG: hypothetical protein FPO08_03780 [Geobacter sp.]
MKVLLIVIGLPIAVFILYNIYRFVLGTVVAVHLNRFEIRYKNCIDTTGSKQLALEQSLVTFKNCPILNRLTEQDYFQIVTILKKSPNPDKIIRKIVIGMHTKKSLQVLKDAEFLAKLSAVGGTDTGRESLYKINQL